MHTHRCEYIFVVYFVIQLIQLGGCPENRMHCVMMMVSCYVCSFQPDTKFCKQVLTYTLFAWDNQCARNFFKLVYPAKQTQVSSITSSLTLRTNFTTHTPICHHKPFDNYFKKSGASELNCYRI